MKSGWKIAAAVMLWAAHAWLAADCRVAAEAPPAANRDALHYRRIYAPADRVGDWPRGNAKYLPISRDEFDRLVAAASATPTSAPTTATAQIVRGEYQARIVGNQLSDGTAGLQVNLPTNKPGILPLEPCGLAIRGAAWAAGAATPPVLGIGADGHLALLVEKADRINLDWSLEGKSEADDTVVFQLELPACPVNVFTIEARDGVTLSCNHGLVRNLGYVDEGIQRWEIQLGGNNRFQLTALPADKKFAREQLAVVSQTTAYDLSARGVELSCQLKIDVYGEPMRSVAVRLDAGLQMIAARCGDQLTPWSETKLSNDESEVILTLPELPQGSGHIVRLTALAPLPAEQPGQLPRQLPRVRPQAAFWEQGTIDVSVHGPLVIESLRPTACRQIGAWPLPAPRGGETLRFQPFSADATIEVGVAFRGPALQATTGTAVEFGAAGTSARVAADIRSVFGLHFAIEAQVGPKWLIDSVESQPTDVIEDWSVDRQDGVTLLRIRLAKAVAPERPVRIIAAAKRPGSPLGQSFSAADVAPLSFRALAGKRIIGLRAIAPCRLQLSGGEGFSSTELRNLEPAQRELLADLPRDVLFEDSAENDGVRIGVASRQAEFTASIRMEATFRDNFIEEDYQMRCVPDSGAVDRVLVTFVPGREQSPRFTLGDKAGQSLNARRLTGNAEGGKSLPSPGERWEVSLPEPIRAPFEISMNRRTPSENAAPLSLACLPEAALQRATVAIRTRGGPVPRIMNNRLQPIPTEPGTAEGNLRLLGFYRYDPARELVVAQAHSPENAATPGLLMLPGGGAKPVAWIWHSSLESWYGTEGLARHTATYRIQNNGLRQMRVKLPAIAPPETCAAWIVGGGGGFRLGEESGDHEIVIDLAEDKRFATVVVQFRTPSSISNLVGKLDPPELTTDLAVLAHSWTAWLPSGYRWYGADGRFSAVPATGLGVAQRLFGPLARDVDDAAFNPLKPATWSPVLAQRAAGQSAMRGLEPLLQAMGEANLEGAASGTQTWRELLGRRPADALPILIDRAALAKLSIAPQTSLGPPLSRIPAVRAANLLQHAGIALVAHPQAILITSQTNAALWHAWIQPTQRINIWQSTDGPLAEQIEQATSGGDQSFVAADVWRRQTSEAAPAWESVEAISGATGAAVGWVAARTALSGSEPAHFGYYRPNAMNVLGVAMFLAALAIAWRQRSSHPPLMLAAQAAVLAALSLLVTEPYVPITSGSLLGLAAYLVWRLIPRRGPTAEQDVPVELSVFADSGPPSKLTVSVPPIIGMITIAAATLCCATAMGEERDAPARHSGYEVFIPIDDQQRPSGDKVQVSEEFYRELHRRAAPASESPQGWILGPALYRSEIIKDLSTDRYVVDSLVGVFDLTIMSAKTRVRIPFHRDGANLAAEGASLDGQEIQVEWESDGQTLAFDVAAPGKYRLKLALRPVGSASGFEASIPRLASSSLELTVPLGMPNVEIASARGEVVRKTKTKLIVATLGPSDRLAVRWNGNADHFGSAPAVDVEQFMWLHVLPGSVSVDVKWKIKVIEGQLRQLQLTADPRLQLLPLTGNGAPTAVMRGTHPQHPSIALVWNEPIRGETTVEARFLLPGVSGVGVIRPPQIAIADARTTRRWLAASIDPALDFEHQASDRFETIPVAEFVAAWGNATAVPVLAMRPGGNDAFWRLVTRAREPRTTVEQSLAVSYSDTGAQLAFDAQLTTTGGVQFQLALTMPENVQVERMSLVSEGIERVAHWSPAKNGEVHVFLKDPVAGRQTLSLGGRMPMPMNQPRPLPDIRVKQSQLLSSLINVYRQPPVQITIGPAHGLTPTSASDDGDPLSAKFGRLVQSLRVDGSAAFECMVKLAPNQPQTRVEQVVWLRRGADVWTAQCDYRLRVASGMADDLRVEAPGTFLGPYKVSPRAAVHAAATAGESRILVMHPPTPIQGEALFSLTGPLGPSLGDRFAAPVFTPQRVKESKRFLALPSQINGRAVVWDTLGMKAGKLPENFPRPSDAASFDIFEITAGSYKAVLNVSDQSLGEARVRLADITTAWQADGSVRGTAVFDVDPGRFTECPLSLPRDCRIIHCAESGIPIEPRADSSGTLRIPLVMARLPQRIEVVFEGKLPEGRSTSLIRLEAPMLGDLPVDQTLWTVIGPACGQWQLAPGEPSVVAWQAEMTRLKNIAAVAQSAAAQSNIPAEDLTNWYHAWAARLTTARRTLETLLAEAPQKQAVRMARLEARTIDQDQTQLAERLGMLKILGQTSGTASTSDVPENLLRRAFDHPTPYAWFLSSGRTDSITMRYHFPATGDFLIRCLLAAAIALGAAGLVLLPAGMTQAWRSRTILRRPYAAAVVGGLAWWLWLWPSWLGWVIIGISLTRWVRSLRRRQAAMQAQPADLIDPTPLQQADP